MYKDLILPYTLAGFEPGIFCTVGGRDDHYATPPGLFCKTFIVEKCSKNYCGILMYPELWANSNWSDLVTLNLTASIELSTHPSCSRSCSLAFPLPTFFGVFFKTRKRLDQGCQISLDSMYQNGETYVYHIATM
jgi:hypothetical protein